MFKCTPLVSLSGPKQNCFQDKGQSGRSSCPSPILILRSPAGVQFSQTIAEMLAPPEVLPRCLCSLAPSLTRLHKRPVFCFCYFRSLTSLSLKKKWRTLRPWIKMSASWSCSCKCPGVATQTVLVMCQPMRCLCTLPCAHRDPGWEMSRVCGIADKPGWMSNT